MADYAHKGQVLPLENQMIPIDKETTFHASYDHGLHGFNQGRTVAPIGPDKTLKFDGASYIEVGNQWRNLDGADNFEIEAWARTSNIQHYSPIVAQWNSGDGKRGFILTFIYGIARIYLGSSLIVSSPTGVIQDNTWHHIKVVRNSGGIKLYVDGIERGSSTSNNLIEVNTEPLTIGAKTDNKVAQAHMLGEIGEVIIRKSGDLIGHWKLNEKEGPVSFDVSNSREDGLWHGAIVPAYGSTVASLEEGKFRQGVLIEPDSKNLAPYTDYSNRTYGQIYTASSWDTDSATITYYSGGGYSGLPYKKMYKDAGGTGGSFLDDHSTFTLADNKTYTVSAWMKADRDITLNDYALSINRVSDNKYITNGNSYHLTREWRRYYFTFTTATGIAGEWRNRSIVYIDENLPLEVYWCGFQIEERDFPTSFMYDSRPLGKLWYPQKLIDPNAFTISCWFNVPHMHTVSTNNGGITGWWHHPLIEIATPTSGSFDSLVMLGPRPSTWDGRPTLRISRADGTYGDATGITSIQDNTWYHLVYTYDGATGIHKLYIDGVAEASLTLTRTPKEDAFVMVGGGYAGKPFMRVDEVRIESRVISDEEASAWAASGLHYNYLDYSMIAD